MSTQSYPLLDRASSPDALRRLERDQLPQLAGELRQFLLDTISASGGHFGASLGCVELTIALHYLLDTPYDRLIWDVGHQAHGHKVLTGRRQHLSRLRRRDGLAPFPSRTESGFDAFGAGHASTSIGAATGMALASRRQAEKRRHVAVIGDGGLTGGMAWEALQHLGGAKLPVLVIVNENRMSISHNTGQLVELLADPEHFGLAETFRSMGLAYHGPVDGHDLDVLINTLDKLRDIDQPAVLHVRTVKGKGYPAAEADPVGYHAVPVFDLKHGKPPGSKTASWSDVVGEWLCHRAARMPSLHAITPAMKEGSGLVRFAEQFPERFHDVAIAEQHAAVLAAGLAAAGERPVLAIYSTFMQRAMDQIIHDIALQRLPVTMVLDRAGLVGGDGATHQGAFDIALLRSIPDIRLLSPSSESELWQLLNVAIEHPGPVAIRVPRGKVTGLGLPQERDSVIEPNVGEWHRGQTCAVLATGPILHSLLPICRSKGWSLYALPEIKPFPTEALRRICHSHKALISVEEHAAIGGLGSAVAEHLVSLGLSLPLHTIGLPDKFIGHGSYSENLEEAGLDATTLLTRIQQFLDSSFKNKKN